MRGVAQREALIATFDHALHRGVFFAPDGTQAHLAFLANHVRMNVERLTQFAPAIEIGVQFERGPEHVTFPHHAVPFIDVA